MKPKIRYDRKSKKYGCIARSEFYLHWFGYGETPEEAYLDFCGQNLWRACDRANIYHLAA